ncbi:interferon alpha/beta receptor 1-like [Passer domesticus]|uniref:interferon alpha/beta receptor 1-like n=1 Tax=Passer domesticus TaxID=48849 RepID=UPI0030FF2B7E
MAEPGAGAAAGRGEGRTEEPEEPGHGRTEEPWGGWTAERRRLWAPGGRWLAAVLPLLLAPLPGAGQSSLPSPEDVRVHVVNTNFTLSWHFQGTEPGVTFSAQFQWPELEDTGWQELPGCQAVAGTGCDFSSAISEYYDAHYVRVRAQAGPLLSPWSEVLEMVPEHVGTSSGLLGTLCFLQHLGRVLLPCPAQVGPLLQSLQP